MEHPGPLLEIEPQPMVDRELVFLIMVGTVLSVVTGWSWYLADIQHVVLPAVLWISALALLVIVLLAQLQLQLSGKQEIHEIFIQQSIDNNLNMIKKKV